jgi:hypothetical protein
MKFVISFKKIHLYNLHLFLQNSMVYLMGGCPTGAKRENERGGSNGLSLPDYVRNLRCPDKV